MSLERQCPPPLTCCFFSVLQGPLPNTGCHFWLMVWQQKTKAVVMLNRIVEKESVSNTWYLQLTVQSVIVNL